jgi:hypothetical protein
MSSHAANPPLFLNLMEDRRIIAFGATIRDKTGEPEITQTMLSGG